LVSKLVASTPTSVGQHLWLMQQETGMVDLYQ